jgi:hypothetical protein
MNVTAGILVLIFLVGVSMQVPVSNTADTVGTKSEAKEHYLEPIPNTMATKTVPSIKSIVGKRSTRFKTSVNNSTTEKPLERNPLQKQDVNESSDLESNENENVFGISD